MPGTEESPFGVPEGVTSVSIGILGVVSTLVTWWFLNNLSNYPEGLVYEPQYDRYKEEPDWLALTSDKEKVEPAESKVEPAESKVEPAESKVESKVESKANLGEPSRTSALSKPNPSRTESKDSYKQTRFEDNEQE